MGILLVLIGLALLGFGLAQKLKGNRILAAPFHKTGEISKNPSVADAKGMVSTEGAILAPKPLLSPCSKTPCLYYEVKIERSWEKQEQTQNGVETKKGSSKVSDMKDGAVFQLDDGTGPINVNLKDGADVETKKTYDDKVKIGMQVPGELVFGELRLQTPRLPSGERTVAFTAVEKIVPANGSFFALGKLDNGTLVKPGWRSMMLSNKGRDGLISSSAKKSKIGFISGGVAVALSIPLFIWGPKPAPKTSDDCHALFADAQPKCDDSVSSSLGRDYTWTVSKAGTYTLAVEPPKVKFPLGPSVTIKDSTGKQVAFGESESRGSRTAITQEFAPGTYSINVRDYVGKTVSGGFSYQLEVSQASVAEADPATAAKAEEPKEAAPAPKAAPPPGKKVAKKATGTHQGRHGQ
jgi:hypothetical protein